MYIHENKYVSFVSQEVITQWISILTNTISAKPFRVITVLMGNYLMQNLHFLLHLESMSIYSDKYMRKKPSNIVSIPQIPFHHSLNIKPVVMGICFNLMTSHQNGTILLPLLSEYPDYFYPSEPHLLCSY